MRLRPISNEVKNSLVILGVNGYIGSNLLRRAIQDPNIEIKAVAHGKIPSDFPRSARVQIYKGTIFDRTLLPRILKKGDTVVNAVGSTTASHDFKIDIELNVTAHQVLLEECIRAKVKKIIFLSTIHVYRPSAKAAHESDLIYPQDTYSLTKVLGETLYAYFHRVYQIPVIILRLGSVYGPSQPKGVLYTLAHSIRETRTITIPARPLYRDFVFITDAVDAILKAAAFKTNGIEYFNISNSRRVSFSALIAEVTRMVPIPISVVKKGSAPRVSSTFADTSHAAKFLHFRPCMSFTKGLAETLSSYGLLN